MPHRPEPYLLGDDDAAEPIDRRRQLVVDDDVVVLGEGGHLIPGDLEAPLNGVLAVLAAAAQPLFEHLEGRRHHEHRGGLDAAPPHLPRALDIDDQDDVWPDSRIRSVSAQHVP